MAQGRLTPAELAAFASDFASLRIETTEQTEQPTALVITGQDGAGNRAVVGELLEKLDRNGGYVEISREGVGNALPYYDGLGERGAVAPVWLGTDIDRATTATVAHVAATRRNLVIEGLPRDMDASLKMLRDLRAAGYNVEVHAVAVNDQVSFERATARFELEHSAGRGLRPTSRDSHDFGYQATADAVRAIEYTASADRVVVYNRLADRIHDKVPTQGQPEGANKLDAARAQLTVYERINLAQRWDEIVESMDRREATQPQRDNVQLALERAHYSLRASSQASSSYDYDYPSEKQASIELAEAYGHRLEVAFSSGDLPAARMLPELTTAFTTQALAKKYTEAQPKLASNSAMQEAVLKGITDRIADALRTGQELKPVSVRDGGPASIHDVAHEIE